MATDFLGQNLNIGDDVIFLNYNGTSANLERGKITKVFPHTAEIGRKRRAEYKIVKILTDISPVVYCKDCVHWDDDPDTYGADSGPKGKCMKSFETMCTDDFCSYGERKDEK